MLQTNNFGRWEGNMVADPETPAEGIVTFRLAVNNGGYQDGKMDAGFFTVKVYLSSVVPMHKDFILRQLESGKFSKSTRVSVLGSLRQERWKSSDDSNRDKIVIVAHQVDYAAMGRSEDENRTDGASPASEARATTLPEAF